MTFIAVKQARWRTRSRAPDPAHCTQAGALI
jgi:hypothetical protein